MRVTLEDGIPMLIVLNSHQFLQQGILLVELIQSILQFIVDGHLIGVCLEQTIRLNDAKDRE